MQKGIGTTYGKECSLEYGHYNSWKTFNSDYKIVGVFFFLHLHTKMVLTWKMINHRCVQGYKTLTSLSNLIKRLYK